MNCCRKGLSILRFNAQFGELLNQYGEIGFKAAEEFFMIRWHISLTLHTKGVRTERCTANETFIESQLKLNP